MRLIGSLPGGTAGRGANGQNRQTGTGSRRFRFLHLENLVEILAEKRMIYDDLYKFRIADSGFLL